MFLFSLFFSSNILLQFKSASEAISAIVVLMLPFIFISSGIYYYYKIFQLKQLNPIDAIIILSFTLLIYNAVTVHMIFNVKIVKTLYAGSPRFSVVMCSLVYYVIRSNKVTLKQYVYANLMLCWFCFVLYTFVSLTVDPATFQDSLGEGLVGYNPSKGGYLFRFSSR